MSKEIKIIPAIIPDDLNHLEAQIFLVEKFAPLVQIDILDGKFAPTVTWPFNDPKVSPFLSLSSPPASPCEAWRAGSSKLGFKSNFELDLMILNPEESLDRWIEMNPKSIIIHFESTKSLDEIIKKTKEAGINIGIALKPSTSNEEIYPYIENIDFIQLMGSDKIGYHGVSLDEKVFEKSKDLRNRYPNLDIAVDIGVNLETAQKLVNAGVNKLVSGSAIFNTENPEKAYKSLASQEEAKL